MKVFKIIGILLFLIKFTSYAQQNTNLKRISSAEVNKAGTGRSVYIYDDNLNKFIGTWVGEKDGKSVKIIFVKKAFLLSKDPANKSEIEIITGTFQYFDNETLVKSYTNDEMSASSHNKDTLNVFIDVKARKTQAALLVTFLQDGTLKLQIEKNRFEYKNDKDFELHGSMILTKQN